MKWETSSQIELDVFQDLVRGFGFDAVLGNSTCAADVVTLDSAGSIEKISFWMRIRGQYQPLTLEARALDVFVIDV